MNVELNLVQIGALVFAFISALATSGLGGWAISIIKWRWDTNQRLDTNEKALNGIPKSLKGIQESVEQLRNECIDRDDKLERCFHEELKSSHEKSHKTNTDIYNRLLAVDKGLSKLNGGTDK